MRDGVMMAELDKLRMTEKNRRVSSLNGVMED